MSGEQSTSRSGKKRQESVPSDVESIIGDQPDDLTKNPDDSDNLNEVIRESFKEMSEEEMAQHLKLCMKLSAENKINIKNAFGLHLIEILQKMVNKTEQTDIQQASLSLQASSKIYAGRVEALYQDTMRFHSHLQSIMSGNKKDKKKITEDDICDVEEDSSDKSRTKSKSKCKSFLKSEESLSMEQDVSSQSAREPHANFVTINAAFSTSRLAPKLLSSLRLSNDSCMLRCAVSELCCKPRNALTNVPFGISPKLQGTLENIKNFNVARSNLESLSESTKASSVPYMSTPKPVAPHSLFDDDDDDDHIAADAAIAVDDVSVINDPTDDPHSVESAIERFDVLNITADAFVNDISAAVTNQGIDHRLLPPNSVLKKMLDRSRRSTIKPSVGKSTRKKAKEPFFAERSANDIKHLFVKGRATTVSQKILSEWSIENTSNIDLRYEFIEELENKKEQECYRTTLDQVLDVIKQNDPQYHFKYYFNKMSQVWKFSRRKLCPSESFADTPYADQTEKRVGSLAPNDPEALVLSFQNLSLHDSVHEIPGSSENFSINDNEVPDIQDTDETGFAFASEPFETDIEDLMVKPPELVRPASMKFEKRPVNLNTEKIKDLLQLIILRRLENSQSENGETFVLFSEVYEELKNKLEKEISEFISMQFTFVVLLILANQKTLLIENVNDNTDLSIMQDISEAEDLNNI